MRMCDRCKTEIRQPYVITIGSYGEKIDLCDTCKKEVVEWLRKPKVGRK